MMHALGTIKLQQR